MTATRAEAKPWWLDKERTDAATVAWFGRVFGPVWPELWRAGVLFAGIGIFWSIRSVSVASPLVLPRWLSLIAVVAWILGYQTGRLLERGVGRGGTNDEDGRGDDRTGGE